MASVMKGLDLLSTLFVSALGCGVLFLLVVFAMDRLQSRDSILRNYPVIGHMRYILSSSRRILPAIFLCDGPGGASL